MSTAILKNKKGISFESLLILIEQLSEDQKQIVFERLRRNELKKIQAGFQKLAQSIPKPEMTDEEINAEIKAYRMGN